MPATLVPVPTPAPAPSRPHPLGPRDVIEMIAGPVKVLLVAAGVFLALATGYQLGRDSATLTILASPRATTGVAWTCGGQLTATVAMDGLGVAPVQLRVGGVEVPSALAHRRDGGTALVPDDAGRLEAVVGPVPYAAGLNRVQVEAVDPSGDVAPREVSVPVLPCDPPGR